MDCINRLVFINSNVGPFIREEKPLILNKKWIESFLVDKFNF